jgi:hypothetical protein
MDKKRVRVVGRVIDGKVIPAESLYYNPILKGEVSMTTLRYSYKQWPTYPTLDTGDELVALDWGVENGNDLIIAWCADETSAILVCGALNSAFGSDQSQSEDDQYCPDSFGSEHRWIHNGAYSYCDNCMKVVDR